MTFEKFIKKLATHKGECKLTGWGSIREIDSLKCPIDLVGGDWSAEGGNLKLRPLVHDDIVGAADNRSLTGRRGEYRRAMLEALGLSS